MLRPSSLALLVVALAPQAGAQEAPPGRAADVGAPGSGAAQDESRTGGKETSPEEAFDKAYARAQDAMEAQRWKEAYNRLRRLIDEHQGADYVVDRLGPLEADLKCCAFWETQAEPRLKTLIDAELLTWNRNTGGLRLRVDPGHLGDFYVHGAKPDAIYELPAQLSDEWEVTLRGTAHSLGGTRVFAFLDDKSYAVVIGHRPAGEAVIYYKHAAFVLEGESQILIADEEPEVVDSRKQREARVELSKRALRLYVDGRKLLDVPRKDDGGFGRMAFSALEFESLLFTGKAESGWLDGVIDAAVQDARSAFDRTWDRTQHLPAWLLEAAGIGSGEEPADHGAFPMPPLDLPHAGVPRTLEHLQKVQELLSASRPDAAVEYLRGLGPADVDPPARAFLESLCLLLASRPREAMDAGIDLWTKHGRSLAVGYLEALIRFQLKRESEAEAAFRRLTEQHPKAFEPWYALATVLLTQRKASEAREVINLGQAQASDPMPLRRLESRLTLLFKGPAWRRVHEQRAGHFVVRTDTDVRTCLWVARECDAAWKDYEELFGPVKMPRGTTTPVFLFKGQAGFRAYAESAFKRDLEHTAGLFDPYLQAILVWSAPARDTLQRTLRHEVLHHYLDARMGAVPAWFDEGMAEYCEIAAVERGRAVLGAPQREHVQSLASAAAPIDLERLVHLAPNQFYAASQTSYPQSWALVHFLRDTTPERRQRFEDLWARLDRREDNDSALAAAFEGVDWKVWSKQMLEHVRGLADSR